jgi:hypothetical protein
MICRNDNIISTIYAIKYKNQSGETGMDIYPPERNPEDEIEESLRNDLARVFTSARIYCAW